MTLDSTIDFADHWLDGESEPRRIEAGDWSLTLDGTHLDDIAFRGVSILRGLRFVVRDHDWRTPASQADHVELSTHGSETVVTIRAHVDELGCGFGWTGRLTLGAASLRYEVTGRAITPFRRNRIGLVALHSPELAGTPLVVLHPTTASTAPAPSTSGPSSTSTVFPTAIAPHQPAHDIAGLRWSAGGLDARLQFAGDVFEMEDQRNWTDASFKTYSTPLSLPFPVEIAPGDAVRQSVALSVSPSSAIPSPGVPSAAVPTVTATRPESAGCTAPTVSVGSSTAPGSLLPSPPWMRRVTVLVELDATGPSWSRVLARARNDGPEAAFDIRLVASEPDQLDPVIHALGGVPVTRLSVFDAATHVTTRALFARLRLRADAENLTAALIGGTRAHFTELNRTKDSLADDLEGVTFSVTPQMHDTSRKQVLESLGVQRLVAREAVRIAGGRPVDIGPVTLRARFNAVATSSRPAPPTDVLTDGYGAQVVWNASDPRQRSAGYAAWLLASYRALAVPGVRSISFAEAWGPRGFGSSDGTPYPAAEVLSWLVDLSGAEIDGGAFDPSVPVLVARQGERTTMLAANLTTATVRVDAGGASHVLAPLDVVRRLV